MTVKKPLTITTYDNTLINEESVFIIHTSTSCSLIEEVFLKFKYGNYKEGLEIADRICKTVNEWLNNNK